MTAITVFEGIMVITMITSFFFICGLLVKINRLESFIKSTENTITRKLEYIETSLAYTRDDLLYIVPVIRELEDALSFDEEDEDDEEYEDEDEDDEEYEDEDEDDEEYRNKNCDIKIVIDEDPIHLITPNQFFFDCELDYNQFYLQYHADVDELRFYYADDSYDYIVIDNVEQCIGDGLKFFGVSSGDDSVVYVRNNVFHADFRITKV